jgi:hypothetical protein
MRGKRLVYGVVTAEAPEVCQPSIYGDARSATFIRSDAAFRRIYRGRGRQCHRDGEDADGEGGPARSITEFLQQRGDAYEIDAAYCDQYGRNVTGNPNGYLRKIVTCLLAPTDPDGFVPILFGSPPP